MPTKLTIVAQPGSSVVSGTAIAPAVQVAVQDAKGATVTTSTQTVSLSITSGTGTTGAVLGGTLTQSAVSGVATFNNLTLDKVGAGYTLTATAPALTSATSGAIAVTPGAATKLAFAAQPTGAASGATISPAVQVLVQDASGNTVSTATNGITVALTSGTGTSGATLGGTLTQSAVNGVSTFNNLTVNKVGAGYTLTVTATALTGGSSSAFAITAGAATSMAIAAGQSQTATAGTAVATVPSVTVTDANGNAVAGVAVVFAVASGGGTVSGGAATADASGVAKVTSWTLGTTAGANTLTATSTGLTGSPITFSATGTVGPASALTKVAGDNQSAGVGTAVATPPSVKLADANGNVVAGATVTFAVASGGGSVTGGTQTTNASGVATIGSWTLGASGANTLTATSSGVASLTFAATATAATTDIRFCGPSAPVWFAFQDNVGAWTTVTGANNAYTVSIAARGGIAFVENRGGKYQTVVVYGTKAELAALACIPLIADYFAGTKTFFGTIVGIGAFSTRTNFHPAGYSSTDVGDVRTFTMSNAPDGPHDLVATRYSGNQDASVTDKLIVRRGINPTHGSTIPVLDYNSAEGVTPASASYTINGVGNVPWAMQVSTATAAGGTVTISTANGVGGSGNVAVPYQGWPASLQTTGDYNDVAFESSGRGLLHTFASVSNRSITIGPALSTPTITTLATSPSIRLRAQLPSQSAYSSVFNLQVWQQGTGSTNGCSICNADRAVYVWASAAYFGGLPTTWDVSMPDLSAAGYLSTYGIQTGVPLQWYVSAHSTYGLRQFVSLSTSLDDTPNLFAQRDISPTVFSSAASGLGAAAKSVSPLKWIKGRMRP